MSRPGAKHKHAPKVISAIENTFDPLSNIETGIELGSECQEVIFENSFEKKRVIPYFCNNSRFFTDTLPIYAVFQQITYLGHLSFFQLFDVPSYAAAMELSSF